MAKHKTKTKKPAKRTVTKRAHKPDADHKTIRVLASTYDRAQRMLEAADEGGWKAFKSDRKDRPTLGSILDEALIALEEKLHGASVVQAVPEAPPANDEQPLPADIGETGSEHVANGMSA